MLLEFGLFTNEIIRYQTSWTGRGTGFVVNSMRKDRGTRAGGSSVAVGTTSCERKVINTPDPQRVQAEAG